MPSSKQLTSTKPDHNSSRNAATHLALGESKVRGVVENPTLGEGEDEEGSKKKRAKDVVLESIGEIQGFCAFDFDSGKVRFDRDEPARTPEGEVFRFGGQFARTQDALTERGRGASTIVISSPGGKVPAWLHMFDVRVLGGCYVLGLETAKLPKLVESFEKDAPNVSEIISADGETVVKWLYADEEKNPVHRATICFREAEDFWPKRLEVTKVASTIYKPDGSLHSTNWGSVQQAVDLEVERFRDEWVPKKVTISFAGQPRWRQTLNFTWEKLNEPIDDKLFGWEGFDQSDADAVIDNRLGQLVTVKRFNESQKAGAKGRDKNPSDGAKAEMKRRSSRWMLIVGGNLAVLVLLAVVAVRQRWK